MCRPFGTRVSTARYDALLFLQGAHWAAFVRTLAYINPSPKP